MVMMINPIVGFMVGFEIVWESEETVTTLVIDLGVIRIMFYRPDEDEV